MNATLPALLLPPADVPIPQGIYYHLPAEFYHAEESMSSGGAKNILRSPSRFRLMRDTANDPTKYMNFGTAVHTCILEPERIDEHICVLPELNLHLKADRAERDRIVAERPQAVILSPADRERCQRTVDAVYRHPAARRLLEGGRREVSMFWHDREFGVPCKLRADCINHGGVIDLKTANDASPDGFARAAARYSYHLQAAFYLMGCEHAMDATPEFFVFIAAETEPPHDVGVYSVPGEAILAGQHLENQALALYRDARAAQRWQGYPDTIVPLKLPRWALTFNV